MIEPNERSVAILYDRQGCAHRGDEVVFVMRLINSAADPDRRGPLVESAPAASRRQRSITGALGVVSAGLAVLGSIIVTLPDSDRSMRYIASFFEDERLLVLFAELLVAVGAVVFFGFAIRLPRCVAEPQDESYALGLTGRIVGIAALVTTAPFVALAVVSPAGPDLTRSLMSLADLTEVLLSLAIVGFTMVIATSDTDLPGTFRFAAGVVGLMGVSHAFSSWADVTTSLDVAAPVAFVAFVTLMGAWLIFGSETSAVD
jgi:hypothetical protein